MTDDCGITLINGRTRTIEGCDGSDFIDGNMIRVTFPYRTI